MPMYLVKTANPNRKLHISADTREEADVKFAQMRESAGLTAESTVVSFTEAAPMENVVEHTAESEGQDSAAE